MDFLSKKHEFTFINNQQSTVRVHVTQVSSYPYNIWVEGKSKKYRDSIKLSKENLQRFNPKEIPPIIIVSNQKLGLGGISSYNHVDDVIYFNSYYHTLERIEKVINNSAFAAKNLGDIFQHEISHKRHWDAIKRFYSAHKNRYNSINEAKHQLDENIENYISRQSPMYLYTEITAYAGDCYNFAKCTNSSNIINEVIAEALTLPNLSDDVLIKLIREEINYGKA